jgi:hypothetical protein
MKRINGWMLAGLGIVAAGAALETVRAQGVRTGAASPAGLRGGAGVAAVSARAPDLAVRIRRMPKLSRTVQQRSPEFIGTSSRVSRARVREWALFEVTYETAAEWSDEIVFTYYVLAERRSVDAKAREYSLYQTTIRYSDVSRGEHISCAVLPPAAIQRYGDPVALAVEIAAPDGTVLATDSVTDNKDGKVLPPDWWRKPEVTESKSVVRRDGYLVDRSKTPFALVNIDDYEVVK